MALTAPPPPDASRQSLQEGLARLPDRTKQAFTTAAAGGATPTITAAHEVFSLSPAEIAGGASLDAARPVGWRYFMNQPVAGLLGGSAPATAEVAERGGVHQFSHLQHGWIAEATRRAIELAQNLPQVAGEPFELRLLRLPALLVDALWLKNTGGGEDLVVPVASLSRQLQAGEVYSPAQFMTIVQELSRNRLAFDNAPRP